MKYVDLLPHIADFEISAKFSMLADPPHVVAKVEVNLLVNWISIFRLYIKLFV